MKIQSIELESPYVRRSLASAAMIAAAAIAYAALQLLPGRQNFLVASSEPSRLIVLVVPIVLALGGVWIAPSVVRRRLLSSGVLFLFPLAVLIGDFVAVSGTLPALAALKSTGMVASLIGAWMLANDIAPRSWWGFAVVPLVIPLSIAAIALGQSVGRAYATAPTGGLLVERIDASLDLDAFIRYLVALVPPVLLALGTALLLDDRRGSRAHIWDRARVGGSALLVQPTPQHAVGVQSTVPDEVSTVDAPRMSDKSRMLVSMAIGVLAFLTSFGVVTLLTSQGTGPNVFAAPGGSPVPAFPAGFSCPDSFEGQAIMPSSYSPVDESWFIERGFGTPPPGGCQYENTTDSPLGDLAYIFYPGEGEASRDVFEAWAEDSGLQFAYEDQLSEGIPLVHWASPDSPASGSLNVNLALFEEFRSALVADAFASLEGTAVTLAIFRVAA